MKTVAVVVTYNRLQCLRKVVSALRGQAGLDEIIVVNNGSADGTREWLSNEGLTVINQDNTGGSGGFHAGIRFAYEKGYDYVWCMDDDVYPRQGCLRTLLSWMRDGVGITCPARIQNGRLFITESKTLNFSNPFRRLFCDKLHGRNIGNEPIPIEGMVFEGPLIRREVIEKIGNVRKDLFIFFDDFDYSYRAVQAGFRVLYVPRAVLDKECFSNELSIPQTFRRNRWKTEYRIRNYAYFNKEYGRGSAIRDVRPFIYLVYRYVEHVAMTGDVRAFSRFRNAYRLGCKGVLGQMTSD